MATSQSAKKLAKTLRGKTIQRAIAELSLTEVAARSVVESAIRHTASLVQEDRPFSPDDVEESLWEATKRQANFRAAYAAHRTRLVADIDAIYSAHPTSVTALTPSIGQDTLTDMMMYLRRSGEEYVTPTVKDYLERLGQLAVRLAELRIAMDNIYPGDWESYSFQVGERAKCSTPDAETAVGHADRLARKPRFCWKSLGSTDFTELIVKTAVQFLFAQRRIKRWWPKYGGAAAYRIYQKISCSKHDAQAALRDAYINGMESGALLWITDPLQVQHWLVATGKHELIRSGKKRRKFHNGEAQLDVVLGDLAFLTWSHRPSIVARIREKLNIDENDPRGAEKLSQWLAKHILNLKPKRQHAVLAMYGLQISDMKLLIHEGEGEESPEPLLFRELAEVLGVQTSTAFKTLAKAIDDLRESMKTDLGLD